MCMGADVSCPSALRNARLTCSGWSPAADQGTDCSFHCGFGVLDGRFEPQVSSVPTSPDRSPVSQSLRPVNETESIREPISDLYNMFIDHVKAWAKANGGKKPAKVVMFRDGVGEGMYEIVCKWATSIDRQRPSLRPAVTSWRPCAARRLHWTPATSQRLLL